MSLRLQHRSETRAWEAAPVSSSCRFGDDVWRLDIKAAGRRADQNWLRWTFAPPEGSRIGLADHASLVRAAKCFLWSMAINPPSGRKRSSPASVHHKGMILRTLIEWMALDGMSSFACIDPAAVDRLRIWL